MSWLDGLILGILQAVTEFLPISSSGHLVIGKALLDLQTPGVVLEVILHLGTLVSILAFYAKDILNLVRGVFRQDGNEDRKYVLKIVLATLPAVGVGLGFQNWIDSRFADSELIWAVSLSLILTGVVISSTRWCRGKNLHAISYTTAFVIGMAQALAIMPGISRSGLTIAVGLWLGLGRSAAARFSFLMAIPVLAGAGILKLGEMSSLLLHDLGAILLGFAGSALVGYLMIRWLVVIISRDHFWMFALYCWPLGILTWILL